jgi:hypothetical protein
LSRHPRWVGIDDELACIQGGLAGSEGEMVSVIIEESILAWLREIDYPADRDDLIRAAYQAGVPPMFVNALRDLPAKGFNGRYDVQRALGQRLDEPSVRLSAR